MDTYTNQESDKLIPTRRLLRKFTVKLEMSSNNIRDAILDANSKIISIDY